MRIGRWLFHDAVQEGVLHEDRAIAFLEGTTVQDLLEAGLERALEIGASAVARATGAEPGIDDVQLLAPLKPASIRDFVAFEEHVEGVVKSVDSSEGVVPEWYEFPTYYFTNPHTLLATGDVVVPPAATQRLDFELEVAAVIGHVPGSDGVSLHPAAAGEHIFGYSVFNDWSARDVQSREMKVRLGPCKGKDFGSTIGPWIVTADEFADRHDDEGFLDLRMTVEVNGAPYGSDTLANMGWPLSDLVAYASRDSRVLPGDVLGSGTCGQGCLAELWGRAGSLTPPPLVAGDEVVLRVEGIGEIRNTIGVPRPTPAIPPARKRPGSHSISPR